ARLSADEDETSSARQDVLERVQEHSELALPTDEDAVGPLLKGRLAGAARRGARRCPRRRRGEIERGILPGHPPREQLEPAARLQAELFYELAPCVLVDLQRLGLAVATVQGDHQLPAQALTQRVPGDEGLELGDKVAVAPEREVRVDPLLQSHEAQ